MLIKLVKKLKNKIVKKLFKNRNQRLIDQINSLESDFQRLTNTELRDKSFQLQRQYTSEQSLNTLIPEAFALTREASIRTIGLKHFDVQLLGGLVLNNQKIAEMKTGEGKTLVATLPAFLNAITKKGVHIVTVNDYLANRDQVKMGQIYRFLGLDTGLIEEEMSDIEKRENYNADITYVTNYELTFDYLRDNLALNLDNVVLRPFNYCILDEVDSILIDEAQTPLIISGKLPTSFDKYVITDEAFKYLSINCDYKVDEKNRNITLTETGIEIIEKLVGVDSLYNEQNPWIPYVINAIKAHTLYFNNIHYIIRNNQVIIVDEFTGRSMPDRRWGDGLHQAVEAKEKLTIRPINQSLASISYQNFFLLYPKLSGMTGTAKTSQKEFKKIYSLSVAKIPTAKENQRKDLPDSIYRDQFSKWNAVTEKCKTISKTGQPILIGTKSIEKSEMLAQLFSESKLLYNILNAKPENIRKESETIAQAGKKNSITIATNLAGRGTDIILGGNINFTVEKRLYDILTFIKDYKSPEPILESSFIDPNQEASQKCVSIFFSLMNDPNFFQLSNEDILNFLRENDRLLTPSLSYQYSFRFLINEFILYYKKHQKQESKIVKNLGGLYILGTERNDSRRVDNQLRGRCGRQGDPGTSKFFLALDDTLLRLFGGPKVRDYLKNQILDGFAIESKFLTKRLNSAQAKIEERDYQGRKSLFDYDTILNKQRKFFYYRRRNILKENSLISVIKLIIELGEQLIIENKSKKKKIYTTDERFLIENLVNQNLVSNYLTDINCNPDELELYLMSEFWLLYFENLLELEGYGKRVLAISDRASILKTIDKTWCKYLQEITLLRDAVVWRKYGQKKPLDEFKRDAFNLFEKKKKLLRQLILYDLLRLSII